MNAVVTTVSRSATHSFSKPNQPEVLLLEGLGVEGDVHAGATVKHRSRVARAPEEPNLRQVHLIHAELHDELQAAGFTVGAGDMGENVTTRGIDLLGLPAGTLLRLGEHAVVEVTGLRNPCVQLDGFRHKTYFSSHLVVSTAFDRPPLPPGKISIERTSFASS